jgi:hypothetical protein
MAANSPADAAKKSQEMFQAWADSWVKYFTQAQSDEAVQQAQKIWTEQAAAWTRIFSRAVQNQSLDPLEMWRSMFGSWSDAWIRALAQMPTTEASASAQQLWAKQLETWTNSIAETMSSPDFAQSVAQSTEQMLAWQENFQTTAHPQLDAALRLFNLPSRTQVGRLFEELADLRSQLDALSEQNRMILRELNYARSREPAAAKRPARSPKTDATTKRTRPSR